MKVVGCVAEFNPFHNGHQYFISSAKIQTGATHTVAVMSEYFTQRGEPALLTPAARTEAALSSGVDLVISLPVSFALSSAEKFAFGGVYLLDALGCIDNIAYGSECDENADIIKVSKAVMSEAFTDELTIIPRKDLPFAAIREEAVKNILHDVPRDLISSILRRPNDVLAVEYNKALIKLNSAVMPVAIKRRNVAHDSNTANNGFASASLIRSMISDNSDYSGYLPLKTAEIISREFELGRVVTPNYGERVLTTLRRLDKSDFLGYDGVSEGIENRIFAELSNAKTLEELYDNIKTKRYAHSRIRRIIMNTFIGVTPQTRPSAVKVLGFNEKGAEILHRAKKTSGLPIITKLADYPKDNADIALMLENERKAADMFGALCKSIISIGDEYKKIPVKILKNH